MVSQFHVNAPHTGGATYVTVTGLNFGMGELTMTAALEQGGGDERGPYAVHTRHHAYAHTFTRMRACTCMHMRVHMSTCAQVLHQLVDICDIGGM